MPILKRNSPAQISSRRRIILNTLQKRKKCPATIAIIHPSGLPRWPKAAATPANMEIVNASAGEKRKPQVRELFFGSNMECGSHHALVGVEQDFQIPEGGREVSGSEITAYDGLSRIGYSCAHDVIGR